MELTVTQVCEKIEQIEDLLKNSQAKDFRKLSMEIMMIAYGEDEEYQLDTNHICNHCMNLESEGKLCEDCSDNYSHFISVDNKKIQ